MNLDLYIVSEYKPKHSRFAISISDDKQVLTSLKFDASKIIGVNKFAIVSLISSLGVALQVIQQIRGDTEYLIVHTNNQTIEGLLTGKFSKKLRNAQLLAQLNHLLSKTKVVFSDEFDMNITDHTYMLMKSDNIKSLELPKV